MNPPRHLFDTAARRLQAGATLQWVFGGGYVDTLENTLVATSPLFGWRSEIVTKTNEDYDNGRFIAIAERHALIGYEASLGAVQITS